MLFSVPGSTDSRNPARHIPKGLRARPRESPAVAVESAYPVRPLDTERDLR